MTAVIPSSIFQDSLIARALAPAQPPAEPRNQRQPDGPPTAVAQPRPRTVPSNSRVEGLQQQVRLDVVNPRNRQAVLAYRSLQMAEQRDEVSRMLGVDEYA